MDDCAILDIADRALTALEEMGGDTSDLRRELAFARADRCVCCGAVGDVEAGPQATVSTSALPPYYAICYIMKT